MASGSVVYIDEALVNRGEGGWKSFVRNRLLEVRDVLIEVDKMTRFELLKSNPVSDTEKVNYCYIPPL
jgi:hypothetical protein